MQQYIRDMLQKAFRTLRIIFFSFLGAFFCLRFLPLNTFFGEIVYSFVFLLGTLFFVQGLNVFFLLIQESDRQIEELNKQLEFLDCSNCELLSNSNLYKVFQDLYDLEEFDG